MKDIRKPCYYLGGDIVELGPEWQKEGISECFSAETYIHNAIPRLAKSCGITEFKHTRTPFAEEYHAELDESELLSPHHMSFYKILFGSANWIITLGRYDIAYSSNTLSRYSMAPREGHMTALQRVFAYLKQIFKERLMIDINSPPVRDIIDTNVEPDWTEFYPDVAENLPSERPEPLGNLCTITTYVDADHARDQVTRRSVTGIVKLLNNTPVFWLSKWQKTVESSIHGSEMVASRIAIEQIISLRYCLCMLGVNLEPTSVLVGDNMTVVLNTTIPSSALKKKHQACSYNKVRESIAAGFIRYGHIKNKENVADLLT